MLFNSYVFIFGFLPVTVLVFFVLGHFRPMLARVWLTLASFYFYAGWSLDYVWLIIGSILFNYSVGQIIIAARVGASQSLVSSALYVGVIGNLALLGYYKYADFFIVNVDAALGLNWTLLHVVLPLGISFFTFTQIAYLVDASRGQVRSDADAPVQGLVNYALFVTYFPHLLAGPIIHHTAVMQQFRSREVFRPAPGVMAVGCTLFVIGLAKKVLIADEYVETVGDVFSATQQLPFADAWMGALSYTLQLYFDFSAYSDMAIGLSLLFGVRLPLNFNSPYKSTSIIEFWRRWHMTLSSFLRDYLYISLGGNRKGPARRYVNLYLTMLLGGIWHGAGWTFVIWGALHGFYLVVNHAWRGLFPGSSQAWWQRVIYGAITLFCVIIAWVFFRAPDLTTALSILSSMLGFARDLPGDAVASVAIDRDMGWKIVVGFFIALVMPNSQQIVGLYKIDPAIADDRDVRMFDRARWKRIMYERLSWSVGARSGILFGALFFACLLKLRQVSEFIYYQF